MQNTSFPATGPVLRGTFAGPIEGLAYQTPSLRGMTSATGTFLYRQGEAITFRIGGLVLGATVAAPRLTLAHLVPRVDGKIDKLHDPAVTNLARLVHTLDH